MGILKLRAVRTYPCSSLGTTARHSTGEVLRYLELCNCHAKCVCGWCLLTESTSESAVVLTSHP